MTSLILAAFLITGADAAVQRDPAVLVDSHPLPPPVKWHTTLRGVGVGGQVFEILLDASKVPHLVRVTASLNKRGLGSAKLDPVKYPEIDIFPSVGISQDEIRLMFRFGDARTSCYINDDGRDRLTISFRRGRQPETNIDSFNECERS